MPGVFEFSDGEGPLLITVPHAGTFIPEAIARKMTTAALGVPDTDFFVDRLYGFAKEQGIALLAATHSRYVVDLNRGPDDGDLYPGQFTTGLFPTVTFDERALYHEGSEPGETEKQTRLDNYYFPYHQKIAEELEKRKAKFGYALLWDGHSIKSRVPGFFEGRLPDFNFGTNLGKACGLAVEKALGAVMNDFPDYSTVFNGRFKGGYTTRHYGTPGNGIHAVQLELSQSVYMDEGENGYNKGKEAEGQAVIRLLLQAFLDLGEAHYG